MNFSEYLILKYNVFPPSGTAEGIRELIFNPSNASLKIASDKWDGLKSYGMNLNERDIYERILTMIDRIN
ncbi:MAG: hypothetical protein DRO89_01145 [Candidatus Altiarchaeales archaeon]|nr:MAG: hypothetical protein DRO89_01145 [Candidatus Altiarchaeales archaeon]